MGTFVLGVASVMCLPFTARAGAWTQPPGHLYARVTFAGIDSRSRFDSEGEPIGLEEPNSTRRGTEYQSREIRSYGEYGLTEGFTIYGSLPLKRVRIVEPLAVSTTLVQPEVVHETTGLGDLSFGGRFRIRSGPGPVSIAGEVKLPTGYATTDNPALGNGYVDATLRGLIGASAGWSYVTADLGWMHRWGAYQDAVLWSFEVGGRMLRDYRLRGVVRGVRSLGEPAGDPSGPIFDPALASPRSLSVEAVVGDEIIPGLLLEAGIHHVASGHNTLAGNTVEIGLAWSGRVRTGPSGPVPK